MATYRVLQVADDDALIAFWNGKAKRAMSDAGVREVNTLDRTYLERERDRGRATWTGAFEGAQLVGVQLTLVQRGVPETIYTPWLAFDPDLALTDREIDTYTSGLGGFVLSLFPDMWVSRIYDVPLTAVHARRWCDAHYPRHLDNEQGDRSYEGVISVVRATI